jgi:peroxiredoxin
VTNTVPIEADAIDGSFVPYAQPDVAMIHVGSEVVLGRVGDDGPYLQTCALNESGSIVWQCFDGSGTIDEIAADIADVFGVDIDAVRDDIESLAREVGSAGFLVGVREAVVEVGTEPDGIAVGKPFPDFEAEEENGERFTARGLHGRRALLVSWSPTCGFCSLIGDDLAALVPRLRDAGIELVLLAVGGARAGRASLDRHGLRGRLVLRDDDRVEGFQGLGTPVAYLVDEHGIVAEPLALGATEVVDLARLAAGSSD